MNLDCALHAIDEQYAGASPLEKLRATVGMLLDMLPRGRTFALCAECERAVRESAGGHFFRVTE